MAALLLSLTGDILLMLVPLSPEYFLGGLLAFLCAHIMYSIVFRAQGSNRSFWSLFFGMLLAYAVFLFYFLKDGLKDMLLPVIAYMMVIIVMANYAFLRSRTIPKNSYVFVLIGTILFMISDSIIAINKFASPFYLANICIMLTYALAQYFIVFGLLKQKK